MRRQTAVRATFLVVCATLTLISAPGAAAAKPKFEAYGSCASKKPFKRATHCGYDGPESIRATIVFTSRVGSREVKVCQKITGVPFDRDHQCLKAGSFASKAIPFKFDGARAKIAVRVSFFVRESGSGGRFAKVATARLRFDP
jgi:hypothetical protein